MLDHHRDEEKCQQSDTIRRDFLLSFIAGIVMHGSLMVGVFALLLFGL